MFYADGHGIKQNNKQSLKLLIEAAKQDNDYAFELIDIQYNTMWKRNNEKTRVKKHNYIHLL